MSVHVRTALCAALVLVAGAACVADGTSPAPAPITVYGALLPTATMGTPYEQQLASSVGSPDVTWRVVSGALPPGLALSPQGRLSGTPIDSGTRSFTVEASYRGARGTGDYTMRVREPPLLILTVTLPDATLGAAYSRFLEVEPGEGTTTWSAPLGGLPPGLSLSSSGVITGNPTALGQWTFGVRVERGTRSGTRGLSLAVVAPPLGITTGTLPPGEVGLAYEAQLESTGGVGGNTWDLVAGRLPLGLSLAATGLVTGTPLAEEVQSFTVRLASGSQVVTRVLTMAVAPSSYVAQAVVDMPADAFTPFLVKLFAGGTITWRFPSREHNVIFVPAPGVPADILITSNASVTRTFATPGFFRYDCTIHPGMSGQVVVR